MQRSAALTGFGWGRRGNAPLPDDPRGWLRAQLAAPDAAIFSGLGDSADGLVALRRQRRDRMPGDPLVKPLFAAEVAAQLDALLLTEQPFRERLAWFWCNHFTVSMRQGGTRAVAGPYMREAIRPNVTARFSDLLLAVMRHPAMLLYLDNISSIGPNSRAGLRRHRGLNENLARECLELHTVSPLAGYSQADVTSFAAILTGWGVDMKADRPGFVFRPAAHEPGEKTLMGRVFPEGEEGGVQALRFLGTHPATYRHIATRMVGQFVSDTPPPRDVAHVAGVLHDTQGDLGAAAAALVDLPDAGRPGVKFRTPMDFATAAMRALGLGGAPSAPGDPHAPAHILFGGFASLGQPLWTAPLPNGWSDRAADWSAPADLLARADWSYRLAAFAPDADPLDIAHAALGPALRPATIEAIRHAGARRDGLTLLFSSPEFQRR
ncbi:DUF1800 domain-containing protein [Gluconacetobacter johannae]|uniref:DUF1800 domain-containing protein n=1 Tax=Gluconacetobacter johannae TaxID=112140 RepID=A0A7W4J7N1_9PROT|nr:DUF1800 domain-containing protein [Gluconacetobacter johannae]MBB2176033.1 DUF1800 domain-containing protein [Gluconacetobacter johannae]